ncbi:MAG: hypothetical protein M3296_00905 [Actinomycetota bacterium]|nr:hypothetical protein [Actinomycetota bacterium]
MFTADPHHPVNGAPRDPAPTPRRRWLSELAARIPAVLIILMLGGTAGTLASFG